MNSGRCLCGGVHFQIRGELAPIQICHCTQCRKAQGGPFATNIPVPLADVQFLSGQDLLQSFESSPGKRRVFCRKCGSPVYSQRDTAPDVIRIRAGTLDEPVSAQLGWHIYADSPCSWWSIQDDLPQYPTTKPV